ncbi:vesicle-associated membrane protein 3-like [Ylistrum balloti]|uniref:vesicle-associated membrane protein 3-like n=1 Tax=Ylistrum balloti TaxID=509963 RepID=UPI002905B445|nr:vesicle-associated membrane protein 3-like [Ylistrum balloti]
MKKKHKKDKKEKHSDKKTKKKDKKNKENGYSKDDLYLFELSDVHSASTPNIKHLTEESVPLRPSHRSKSLDELREEAQEITDIMMENVVKIRDREGKLDDLCEKAESLNASTEMFQRTSVLIRRKQWWKNKKMTLLLIVVGACFLVLFTVIITLSASGSI